tara:strand:+ start:7516 stop:7701 length:186 start_codon:yes stop_codon:yes gene_type:complete
VKIENKQDAIRCIKLLKEGYYLEPKTHQSLIDCLEKEIKMVYGTTGIIGKSLFDYLEKEIK